jgi:integrase
MAANRKRRAKGEGGVFKLKGCKFWYLQFRNRDGKMVRQSSRTELLSAAQSMLRDEMRKATHGEASGGEVRALTYDDIRTALLESYAAKGRKSLLTLADGTETLPGLGQLDAFMGWPERTVSVADIKPEIAHRFANARKAEGVGSAIINRSLAALRRMLNLAHMQGRITHVPHIELLSEPPARKGFLKREKFEELLGVLPSHLRPLITAFYYCGMRLEEAKGIEWPAVDLERGVMRLAGEDTKNSEPRVVPLPAQLIHYLGGRVQKVGPVFDATNLRKEWMKGCAAVGLGTLTEVPEKPYDPQYDGLTVHDLRRSAARNLRNAGVPEGLIMKIGGWKTRSVFDRYAIVNEDDVLGAMRTMEALSAAPAQPALPAHEEEEVF